MNRNQRSRNPLLKEEGSFGTAFGWTYVLFFFATLANPLCADEPKLPSPPVEVLRAQDQRIAAMELASRSTVGVFGTDGQGGGSGVILTNSGYVITNYHVSSPFGDRMRCGLSDGKMYEAVIVGIDPTGDIALLKMYGRSDFPAAVIADSDTVKAGHWCFAAGNPFVLATNLQPTITYGIVSGVRRYQYPAGTILEYTDCIQTDAAINPGNSGGPLFNAEGHLIGINGRCSFEKRGRVNVGVGYAISINQVLKFVGQLRAGRLVDHASLGFTVGSDPEGKVVVTNILESSDAFRRGLRYGDEILSLGGREVRTVNQLKNVTGIFPSDWRISLRYRNGEGVVDTFIRLPRLHYEGELWAILEGESKPELPKEGRPEGKGKDGKEVPDGDAERSQDSQSAPSTKSKPIDPLADRLEKRKGFVNFYFNRQELRRVVSLQEAFRFWKETKPVWNGKGNVLGEPTSMEFSTSKDRLAMLVGGKEWSIDAKGNWSQSIQNKESSLLLAGLSLFHRWHRDGPNMLGDAFYFGDAPIENSKSYFDVVQVTFGDAECRFHSDPSSGEIRLIEIKGEEDQDPAEIYFDSYQQEGERRWPNRVRLQFGLEPVLQLEVKASEWIEGAPVPLENATSATSTKKEAGGSP